MYGNDVFDGFNFKATCAFVIRKKIIQFYCISSYNKSAALQGTEGNKNKTKKTDHIPSDLF